MTLTRPMLTAMLVGACSRTAAPSAPPGEVVTSLAGLEAALPRPALKGTVVRRNTATSAWGGERHLLRLGDGSWVDLAGVAAASDWIDQEVTLTGVLASTPLQLGMLQPIEGETGNPLVPFTLREAAACTTSTCSGDPVSSSIGLEQLLLSKKVTLEGELHAATTPDGTELHVIELDDAYVQVRVVAEVSAELTERVGKEVRATGSMRPNDNPGYFVVVAGQEHSLQGAWFLSQPSWSVP